MFISIRNHLSNTEKNETSGARLLRRDRKPYRGFNTFWIKKFNRLKQVGPVDRYLE